ncbi:MAG: WbqC family protein [Acidobacteriia bacterium]|nr:WbqC family protein [Terriglobia bacterium]
MIASIHQPAYLPWPGYFHKMALSDVFIFFDTTQFEKNSFINRNRIKTPQGAAWLSVPVNLRGHLAADILHTSIAGQEWRNKHWRAIELNYRKAPFWSCYSREIEKLYGACYTTIGELCFEQLLLFTKLLGLSTRIVRASELGPFASHKQELVLDICKSVNAAVYISGALGKGYIAPETFLKEGISVYFQDYQPQRYHQLWSPEFVPNLSVVDLLFNEGPRSLTIILAGNATKTDLSNSAVYA